MLFVYCDQSLTLLSGALLQISGCNSSDGRPGVITSAKSATSSYIERSLLKIPQLDGPMPDPYDDVLSTPNVSSLSSSLKVIESAILDTRNIYVIVIEILYFSPIFLLVLVLQGGCLFFRWLLVCHCFFDYPFIFL